MSSRGRRKAPTLASRLPCSCSIYTEDVDSVYNRAVSMGSMVVMPLENMFWGDRYGKVTDPFGHQWGIAQHVEDVAPQEMKAARMPWPQTWPRPPAKTETFHLDSLERPRR